MNNFGHYKYVYVIKSSLEKSLTFTSLKAWLYSYHQQKSHTEFITSPTKKDHVLTDYFLQAPIKMNPAVFSILKNVFVSISQPYYTRI